MNNEIKAWKQSGKDICLFGGAGLTSSLMNLKLANEIHLSVHPVILGEGKPLFHGIEHRINLKLIEAKTYDTGLQVLKYSLT